MRCVLPVLLSLALATPALSEKIGVVSSLTPAMTGKAPNAAKRTLRTGADVVMEDQVVTSAKGRAQLLFLDQTTLSIAPSSQITLDSFIYDPGNRGGQIGIGLTKGTLRFVGGLSSRRKQGVIRTPTATLGIRGSTALVRHVNGRTEAVFISGKRMCLEARGKRHCTSRRGGVLTEAGYQGKISDDALFLLLERIDGPAPAVLERRGSGGTTNIPGDRGTYGTDGSKRDEGMFDDRLGTDTGFGVLDTPPAAPETAPVAPPIMAPDPDPVPDMMPVTPVIEPDQEPVVTPITPVIDPDPIPDPDPDYDPEYDSYYDMCLEFGGDYCNL